MIETIKIDDENLEIIYNWKFNKTKESDAYLSKYKGEFKVIKLFKEKKVIDNKVQKIILLKDKLKDFDNVVTADKFVTNNNEIIGYIMPYISGINFYTEGYLNKKQKINYLKELSSQLKNLHKLNIVLADFIGNTIVGKDKKIYFIDHDNFAIDNFKVDQKNVFLYNYEKSIKTFDYKFDNYLLNIYTISCLTNYLTSYLYSIFEKDPNAFNFKNEEIKKIFNNTMKLDKIYNEELIIDKINSVKDLRKIKIKCYY